MATSFLKYRINYIPLNANAQIGGLNANSLTFINKGTALVTIDNQIELQQEQAFVIDGNLGEVIGNQNFSVAFSGAGTKKCVVIKKDYENI